MKEVEDRLWELTVDDLKEHCKKLGIKSGSIKKQTIQNIMMFYNTENWLEDYFKNLQGFDKEYTYLIVQHNFVPIAKDVKALKEKYNVKTNWWGEIEDNLKFSLKGFIPKIFRDKLLTLVPEIKEEFYEVEGVKEEESYAFIINKRDAIQKFDQFIMYVTTNKVKTTDKTNSLTKGSILKFYEKYSIDDITRHEIEEEPKNQNDTIIVNGIMTILIACDVIKIKEGYLELGKKYQDYIKLNKLEKAKFLFDGYIDSKSTVINETTRMMNYKYKVKSGITLSNPRKSVIDYLKKCPIDKWVLVQDIKRMLRIKKLNFLRDYTGDVYQKEEYGNWYDIAYYKDFEYAFVDSVLMDYLAVLGIVDVTIEDQYTNYDNFYLSAECVRLSEFGAMVLGLKEPQLKEEIKKPLIINERYEIIVEESSKRMEYELYFERFLDKVSTSKTETVYEFNFMGLARAYDLEINPKEVIKYLTEESDNIPEKLLKKINTWMRSFNKISIKTVTVLEAPTEIMKVLQSDNKLKNFQESSKNEYIILKKGKANEVKKEVEKNAYFCKLDE